MKSQHLLLLAAFCSQTRQDQACPRAVALAVPPPSTFHHPPHLLVSLSSKLPLCSPFLPSTFPFPDSAGPPPCSHSSHWKYKEILAYFVCTSLSITPTRWRFLGVGTTQVWLVCGYLPRTENSTWHIVLMKRFETPSLLLAKHEPNKSGQDPGP